MDIVTTTFEEIEQYLISVLKTTEEALQSTDQKHLKKMMVSELEKKIPTWKFTTDTPHSFYIEIPYQHTYEGIQNYGEGAVRLHFVLKTKRSDEMSQITKTKSKYVQVIGDTPILFDKYSVLSCVATFDWESEETGVMTIEKTENITNNDVTFVEQNIHMVQDILDLIYSSYQKTFQKQIAKPYVQQMFYRGNRTEIIYANLNKEVREAIKERNRERIVDEVARFIVEKELIVK